MIIVPVEETPLLLAVDEVVGGVEIEDQVLGRIEMGGEELIDQDLGDLDQGLAVDPVFQAAKGGRRGEGRRRIGVRSGGELQGGIEAESLMVVEILVAQRDGEDPLSEHGLLVMHDDRQPAWVGDDAIEGVEEPEPLAELAKEQSTGVGGEPSAVEVGDDGLGSDPGKVEGVAVTVCHSGGLAVRGLGLVANPKLTRSKAIAPFNDSKADEISGLACP